MAIGVKSADHGANVTVGAAPKKRESQGKGILFDQLLKKGDRDKPVHGSEKGEGSSRVAHQNYSKTLRTMVPTNQAKSFHKIEPFTPPGPEAPQKQREAWAAAVKFEGDFMAHMMEEMYVSASQFAYETIHGKEEEYLAPHLLRELAKPVGTEFAYNSIARQVYEQMMEKMARTGELQRLPIVQKGL